jgi:hypothetical protein
VHFRVRTPTLPRFGAGPEFGSSSDQEIGYRLG